MQKTKNLNLNKPDYTDVADIDDINANMDILDTELNSLNNQVSTVRGDISIIEEDLSKKSGVNHTHTPSSITGLTEALNNKSDTGHKHTAVEISANTDLNDLSEEGYYWCTSGNSDSVINKPDETTFFSLRVTKISGGVLSQELTTSGNRKFIRVCWSGGWTDWSKFAVETDIPTSLKNPKALTILLNGTGQNAYDGSVARSINITASAIGAAASNHSHSELNNIKKRTHIVVATYDTKNSLKVNADYTCTASNASSILKTAIYAVAQGGKVELLDGTYNLQYNEDAIELTKAITIKGSGYTTIIQQPVDEGAGKAKPILVINGQNVRLKDLMLCDKSVSSPVSIIEQQTQGIMYDNIFFIYNASETACDNACIKGSDDCRYTRIQNCRVFKGFVGDKTMFDFSQCTNFGGVIGANISSGNGSISVKFANEGHKNNTAIYGHSNIDIKVEEAN